MKRFILWGLFFGIACLQVNCQKPGTGSDGSGASKQALVSGKIDLDPKFSDRQGPLSTLYIIARGPEGTILAVKKVSPPLTFPLDFSLEPEDQMLGPTPWPDNFSLKVRLDQDGIANREAPGDLIGVPDKDILPAGATGIKVTINSEVQ